MSLRLSTEHLAARGSETPRLDAELLLAQGDGSRANRALHGVRPPADHVGARQRRGSCCRRRASREPLQYVLGEWGFRHLTLTVDRRASDPATRDRDPGRAGPRADRRARDAAGARRRHRIRRDRARDRRRARRSRRHRDRQLGRRARARRRERVAHRARGRSSRLTTCSTASRSGRGSSSSRIRRTSMRPISRGLQPEVRDWEPHGR